MKRSYPVEVERPPNKRNFPNGFNQNHFNGAKVPGCAQNKTTPTSFYHNQPRMNGQPQAAKHPFQPQPEGVNFGASRQTNPRPFFQNGFCHRQRQPNNNGRHPNGHNFNFNGQPFSNGHRFPAHQQNRPNNFYQDKDNPYPQFQHQQNQNGRQGNNNGFVHKPWITPEIQELIRKRNILQKRLQLFNNPAEWNEFKAVRHKVTTLLNAAKFDYEIKLSSEPKATRLFYCDTCDKSCLTQQEFDEHKAEHIVCKLDGCSFTAHPKVVLKHIQMQHSTDLYHRIKGYQTEEEIKQWVADRKNNFPSSLNIEKKKADWEEKRIQRQQQYEKEKSEQLPNSKEKLLKFKRKQPLPFAAQVKRIHDKFQGKNNKNVKNNNQLQQKIAPYMRSYTLLNTSRSDGKDYIHSKNKSPMVTLENYYYSVKFNEKRKLVGKKLTIWKGTLAKDTPLAAQEKDDSSAEEEIAQEKTDICITDDEEEEQIGQPRQRQVSKSEIQAMLSDISAKNNIYKQEDKSSASILVVKPKPIGLAGLLGYGSGSDDLDSDDDPPDEIAIQHKPCSNFF